MENNSVRADSDVKNINKIAMFVSSYIEKADDLRKNNYSEKEFKEKLDNWLDNKSKNKNQLVQKLSEQLKESSSAYELYKSSDNKLVKDLRIDDAAVQCEGLAKACGDWGITQSATIFKKQANFYNEQTTKIDRALDKLDNKDLSSIKDIIAKFSKVETEESTVKHTRVSANLTRKPSSRAR